MVYSCAVVPHTGGGDRHDSARRGCGESVSPRVVVRARRRRGPQAHPVVSKYRDPQGSGRVCPCANLPHRGPRAPGRRQCGEGWVAHPWETLQVGAPRKGGSKGGNQGGGVRHGICHGCGAARRDRGVGSHQGAGAYRMVLAVAFVVTLRCGRCCGGTVTACGTAALRRPAGDTDWPWLLPARVAVVCAACPAAVGCFPLFAWTVRRHTSRLCVPCARHCLALLVVGCWMLPDKVAPTAGE